MERTSMKQGFRRLHRSQVEGMTEVHRQVRVLAGLEIGTRVYPMKISSESIASSNSLVEKSFLMHRLERESSISTDFLAAPFKANPHVACAVMLNQDILGHTGKLFTYVELPENIGMPCHTHACFALSGDRRNIRF